ncbi:MAG: CDP-alcohol phosphatidyltransferase family protein [Hyphomicrobiaceae bacterium]|nr:MAG: CDP-alcohol phosphatidyltransferase family protein [Hyphomicrobiaceae bacterium]
MSIRLATWPNLLSGTRVLLGPVVMALIIQGGPTAYSAALLVMIAAEATDIADGWLGRRIGPQTPIGRLIDIAADTLYHLMVYAAFLANDWMPPMVLFLIFAQELIIPYMRTFGLQRGRRLEIRWSSRAKTFADGLCQIAVVAMILIFYADDPSAGAKAATVLIGIAALASILTTVDHAIAGYDLWSRPETAPPASEMKPPESV